MSTTNYMPYIIEQTPRGERTMDIYTKLLQDRIIFLGSQVVSENSNAIIAQMLFLQMSDPNKPVHLYINSPGGSVSSGMAIYDTMQLLKSKGTEVHTYCIGMAASMGSMLLSGGTKGHRYILTHSQVMIHQPSGGAQGQATDILISAEQIMMWKKVLTQILSNNSGQPLEKVSKDCERDHYLNAKEAIEYGLVDKIMV